jgi:branched-chain amino acid transport system substrate-binding protein
MMVQSRTKGKSMHKAAALGVVAWLGLVLTACGSTSNQANPASPITIGVSVSLTGDFSSDGKALQQGYDLWAQDINAKGGLLGHRVTMKYVDDASSTQQVVTNYQNLITQDHVALVFGPFSSLLTIPASTVVERYGYAFPEPAGGGPSVFNRGLHNIFFVQPAAIEDNLVSYTKFLLGLPADQRPKTAAYATQDDPFTQPQIDKARGLLEAGGITTASYKVYPAETTDFTPLALQVVHSNADVAILGTQEPDAVAFVQTFIQQHYNPKSIIETTGPDQGKDFADKVGGTNTEGIMVPAGWTANATAYGNSTFVDEMIAKYGGAPGDISSDSAEAYSVGQVVDQAATKANSIDNKALVNALHSGTFQTVQGPISFDSTGKPQSSVGVYIEQWQGAGAIFVYPPSVAKAKPEYPKPNWS